MNISLRRSFKEPNHRDEKSRRAFANRKWFRAGTFFLLPFALCPLSLRSFASPPANYYEVWGDEFQGSSLDTSKWQYWLYPGTYKDATLSPSAVSEAGDHVVITTYTSGSTHDTAMLSTQGKFHARYGYFEANIQWSDNSGMWSAFWLQSPAMGSYIGDPGNGGAEIDVCEHRLQDGSANNINNYVQSNIHWNGYGPSAASVGSGNFTDSTANLGSGFHKYGVLWTSSGYTIYVDDGQQKYTTSSGLSARTEFMILSSIVDDTDTTWAGTIPSGGYGSLSSSTTKLAVDYVRYYAPNNTIFWTGTSSPNWFDANNWTSYTTAPASGNDVVFSMLSKGNFSTTLDQNLTVNSLSIWETSPITISSNQLTINSSIDMGSAYNDMTINSDVLLGNANYWSIGSGRTLNVPGRISGGHSLHLENYGTVALYNTNSYTLGTFVDLGTLRLVNGAGLGDPGVGTTVANGATLQVYSSLTCNQPLTLNGTAPALRVSAGASAVWTGPITLANGVTIQLDGGTALAINNSITGGHSLYLAGDGGSQGIVNGSIATGAFPVTKGGAGTWTLAGTNSFTGALNVDSASTTANDGDLVIVSSNSVGTASAIQIQNNTGAGASSTLQLDGSAGNFAVAQPISLNGRNNSVPAIENLAGNNTLSGGITINSGGADYEIQSDSGTLTLGGGISSGVSSARTFTFQGGGGILISGAISNGSATSFNVNQSGPGTLTLATANSYNGSTTVSGGTLALAASGSISNSANIFVTNGGTFDVSQVASGFVLNNGQTLSGNGVVTGSVTCASGAIVSPGNGVSELTLNFSNSVALAGGATLQFDLSNVADEGGGMNDEILIAGNLNLSGTNMLSINPVVGTLASGRYVLARYAGGLNGGATNLVVVFTGVPPQAALTLDFSVTNQIGLVVSAFPGNLVWQGDGAANVWNSGGSSNWFNGAGSSAFYPGDSVTFDNTSTNDTVNLSGTLAPGLVTLNGTSNYVFTGSGKITGVTGLIKNSTGTLTVLTTNNFTGAVAINAGTVQVGNGTTAGALGAGNVINNGALIYNHSDTETNAGAMSGTGIFTKLGSGAINLNGNNSFSGGATLSQGTIAANVSGALGLGPITINNSATQMVLAAGVTISNAITVSPGASSGAFASGILKGPASGSATLTGPMNITALTGSGGHFDGGNSTGGLVISGAITASSPVRHRANRVTFAGGGNYTFFWSEGTTVLGATNGLATNAVADLGYSGAAGILDLAGFSQTLNGLLKGSQTATVGNSSTNSDSALTISGVSSNTTYAGTIQDSVSGGTHKVFLTVGGGTFTLSAANTFSGDTELAGGTLALSSSTALQNSPLNLAAGDTGVLNFGTLTSATIGGLKGSRNLGLANSSGAVVALTVGNGNTNTYIYSGALTGGGSLTKASAGTLVLNGTNTFTGVLNTDTGQPSTGNDGIVYLASPGAVSGASSIAIRNQNAAYSTLQLDGTAGNINLAQNISLNGRNNSVAAIENVAGSNTFAGNVSLGSGGGTYTIQSDSGQLTFSGGVGIHSLTSGRTFTFAGSGAILVSGVLTNGSSFANAVANYGAGALTLAGTNNYTGGTTNFGGTLLVNGVISTNVVIVTGGALGGSGVIRGPVTVQSGGTLSPGAILGATSALTISNNLNLSGTTFLALNPAAGTNDLIRGLTTVTYGGTLSLTNLGGSLSSNSVFKLFNAAGYSGAFTDISPALPAPGFAWDTNTLTTDGTLRIVQTASSTPTNINFQMSGNQLTLSWPTNYTGWRLQTQTNNLAAGLGTNWVDVPGSTLTNQETFTIDPASGAIFYRMVFP
jgi:fibronectin-binding autotransporter adhesin